MSTDKLMNGDLAPVYVDRRPRVRRAAVQAACAVGLVLVITGLVMVALQNWRLRQRLDLLESSNEERFAANEERFDQLLERVASLEGLADHEDKSFGDNDSKEKTEPAHSDLLQLPVPPDTSTANRRRAKRAANALTVPLGDCDELFKAGYGSSGVYTIQPVASRDPFQVYCEMTGRAGWTVIQKRFDGSVNFSQDWEGYKNGFGDLSGEFWLGNDKIYQITNVRSYRLKIDLENWSSETVFAEYATFYVEDEAANYRLQVGVYSGIAGDSLSWQDGYPFSTHDQDNDPHPHSIHCSIVHGGRAGWWYRTLGTACERSNLNQPYKHGGDGTDHYGIQWNHWSGHHFSIKSSVMKIRPNLP
ncbi:PREDICTED: fibrinogen-like protein 1 [Branchiostoma belcheri]|uniref:Fibrinogen-like protein 1 n=1 Tax=Branchiostoma belcheri TaxID=7741 RepID=A0A6P4Y569_BRABE|nr:PREDICTED: fibrinogen-like protein 1 [Branchiostoma belcheri]